MRGMPEDDCVDHHELNGLSRAKVFGESVPGPHGTRTAQGELETRAEAASRGRVYEHIDVSKVCRHPLASIRRCSYQGRYTEDNPRGGTGVAQG